jgi:hypothetical protein
MKTRSLIENFDFAVHKNYVLSTAQTHQILLSFLSCEDVNSLYLAINAHLCDRCAGCDECRVGVQWDDGKYHCMIIQAGNGVPAHEWRDMIEELARAYKEVGE